MTVFVNEKETVLESGSSVEAVLELLGYKKSRSIVWINGRKLLAAEYDTWILEPGDEVKAVRLFSGG